MAQQSVAAVAAQAAPSMGGLLLRNNNTTAVAVLGQLLKSSLPPSDCFSQVSGKRVVAKVLMAAVATVYGVYPVSLLLLFRTPEQMSWLKVFERHHACQASGDCRPIRRIHLGLLATTAVWTLLAVQHRWRTAGLGLLLAVAAFRGSVDHLLLFRADASNSSLDLTDRVAVVTGGNRGIGFAAARAVACAGGHAVLACRSIAKCRVAVERIRTECPRGSASFETFNLNSLESAYNLTQQLSSEHPSIHYLFCNAGTTPERNLTVDGFEDGFGGMHLAHMALVLGLLPSLIRAGETSGTPARVVMVSSEMAVASAVGVFGTDPLFPPNSDSFDDLRGERTVGDGTMGNSLPAYGRAKLCNLLLALELNRRLVRTAVPVRAHAVHAGAVVTGTSRSSVASVFRSIPGLSWVVSYFYMPLLWRSVDGGARVLLCAAFSPDEAIAQGGQYLDALCHPYLPADHSNFVLSNDENYDKFTFPPWSDTAIHKDPILALQVADRLWSARLWNVSLALLQDSPAKELVQLAP